MLPLLVTLLLAVIVLATAAWWIKTRSSVAIIEVAAPEQVVYALRAPGFPGMGSLC